MEWILESLKSKTVIWYEIVKTYFRQFEKQWWNQGNNKVHYLSALAKLGFML